MNSVWTSYNANRNCTHENPLFMPNSACDRPIVKNAKILGNYVKFWILTYLQNTES